MKSVYNTLVSIDVKPYIERKNGFDYVSWSHAIHELKRHYPLATWGHDEWQGMPWIKCPGDGYLVRAWCEVEGIRHSVQHAVTDHRNKPIAQPTCADISNSIQRATVKAIALHGLGLSVYAGEDLPADDVEVERAPAPAPKKATVQSSKPEPKPEPARVAPAPAGGRSASKTILEMMDTADNCEKDQHFDQALEEWAYELDGLTRGKENVLAYFAVRRAIMNDQEPRPEDVEMASALDALRPKR